MSRTTARWLLLLFALTACRRITSPAETLPAIDTSPGTGPAALVDVFIGTGNSDAPDPVPNGASGNTFPGATAPFGMVQWSPDTPQSEPPGYNYAADRILGFSVTHLNGVGCAAQRDFPVLPVVGKFDSRVEQSVTFKHSNEIASPGFYGVTLDSGARVDLTATARTGLARFTFPGETEGGLLLQTGWQLDLLVIRDVDLKIAGPDLVTGSRANDFCGSFDPTRVYFAAKFDRPFTKALGFGSDSLQALDPDLTEVTGFPGGFFLGFDTDVVHMKVGLSYVSVENAIANMEAENPGWDFNTVRRQTLQQWDEHLGRIKVEGGTVDERRMFYTALYHSFVQPNTFSDVNGDFIGFDGLIHKADGYVRYANFSGWDIYRSWIQLVSWLLPDETSDMVRSLVDSGAECGALPKWAYGRNDTGTMVGDPADIIVANAWAFGARDFDTNKALELMIHGATDPDANCNRWKARPALKDYLGRGYCAADGEYVWGPPATTQEYAIADYAIAQFARAQNDLETYRTFLARSGSWKNVFNPDHEARGFRGYPLPRLLADDNGQPRWQVVDVSKNEGFVEGNAAQYTFMVPHDVPGLIEKLGGDAATIARLDDHFTQVNAGVNLPYFYMGNEPNFWTPWEYPFAGAPWKTQDVVRRIAARAYSATPGGLPGNDDLGAMSSWLVWAKLGLYPVVPGVPGFVLGSPSFERIEVSLPRGRKLVIAARGASYERRFVQSLKVNGQPSTSTWLPLSAFVDGGTLEFELGTEPNTAWGSGPDDRPPAFDE